MAVPGTLVPTFVKQFHQRTHLGRTALETTLSWYFCVLQLSSISQVVCERCEVCANNNPRQVSCAPLGIQSVGGTSFDELEIDVTEMPRSWGLKHLLVFICTYSGWGDAYPTQTEKAREVARSLL